MASRRGRSSERGADVGEGVELEVGLHEPVGVGVAERQPERLAGRGEPVAGHGREVAVAAHQAPLPGVLELPGAPELAERWAVAGPDPVAGERHRVDVEERPVGVEDDGAEHHQR
jgi:hypothetical protein